MNIISRSEAKSLGLKRYFTGGQCINGHVDERTTSDGQCAVCCLEKMRSRRAISKKISALEAGKRFNAALTSAKAAFAGGLRANGRRISRPIAKLLAMETYFPGSCCKNGHIADRFVCSGNCVICSHKFKKDDYHNNKFEHSLKHREWRKRNPEYRSEYRAKNPELFRAIDARHGALRRDRKAGGMSSAALRIWLKGQKKICYWCGAKCPKKYHVDHYQPLSKGGAHVVANLVIACPRCNLTKNAKDPYEFAASVGRLF